MQAFAEVLNRGRALQEAPEPEVAETLAAGVTEADLEPVLDPNAPVELAGEAAETGAAAREDQGEPATPAAAEIDPFADYIAHVNAKRAGTSPS